MAKLDLTQYGITGSTVIAHNPSYEYLYEEETKEGLTGFDKGQDTELNAVNVMTGIYTGRSPKDKYIVDDAQSHDKVWWTTEGYKNDNHPMSEEVWAKVKEIAINELCNKNLYVMDAFCGANEATRLRVRFIMENMPFFISPPYHVLMMHCSRVVVLKATQVSELSPSAL